MINGCGCLEKSHSVIARDKLKLLQCTLVMVFVKAYDLSVGNFSRFS